MAMTTLTTVSSLSQTLSLDNNSNNNSFRDVSFSSYLDSSDESFVREFAESSRSLGKKEHTQKEDDEEIRVFTAEKYFNGGMEDVSPRLAYMMRRKLQNSRKIEADVVSSKSKTHSGTPRTRSESSWNSQTTLLHNCHRDLPQKKPNKMHCRTLLSSLRCKCSDKDSVEVEVDRVGGTSFKKSPGITRSESIKASLDLQQKQCSGFRMKDETRSHNLDVLAMEANKDVFFSFPSLNSASGNVPIKTKQLEEELIPRNSIEVFGSPVHETRNKSPSFDKKLTVFPWEATPRIGNFEFSAKSASVNDDNDSEASSDLFEIESFTGKVKPFLATQESDVTSGCLSPNYYAPSEASIEWSVVTASAADFSVISDYEEIRPPPTIGGSPIKKTFPTLASAKTRASKQRPKRHPAITLGCKSQKSVSVAGDAYIAHDKANFDSRIHRMSESNAAVTRFQDERKLTGFGPKHNHSQPARFRELTHHSVHNTSSNAEFYTNLESLQIT